MLRILADLHTHTLASTHAYSTIQECAAAAKAKGLQAIGMTDHGPALPDGAHAYHFQNIGTVPSQMDGVRILRGAECNIINAHGELDLGWELKGLELVIASVHHVVFRPADLEEHTACYLQCMENNRIDILGHIGRLDVPLDVDRVVLAAKAHGVLVEINAHTIGYNKGGSGRCLEVARACMRHGVPVVVNSDSHISFDVGHVQPALDLLDSLRFPQELVMNASLEQYLQYKQRGE